MPNCVPSRDLGVIAHGSIITKLIFLSFSPNLYGPQDAFWTTGLAGRRPLAALGRISHGSHGSVSRRFEFEVAAHEGALDSQHTAGKAGRKLRSMRQSWPVSSY